MIKNVKDSIIAIIHDIEDPPGYCWMLKSLYEFQKRNLMLNHMFFNLKMSEGASMTSSKM